MNKIPYKVNPNLIIKEFQGHYILETAHVVNKIGKKIIDCINGKRDVTKIAELISKDYPALSFEEIYRDVSSFIDNLKEEKIISYKTSNGNSI